MDAQQFKDLFLPLQSPMQLLAERILNNADDAEDVVQEVFLTLWEHRSQLETHENPQGYAMLTIRSRCLDLLRRRNRQAALEASLRILSDQALFLEIDERQQHYDLLMELLQQLPPKQRRLIEMKYLEQRDTDEMQHELGMSPANIYTTLSRTLKTLKDNLKHHHPTL